MPDEQYEVVLVLQAQNRTGQTIPQVNSQLQQLERNAESATRGGRNLAQGFNTMQTAAIGFIGAVAGSELINFVEDMNAAGDSANRAEEIFDSLTGSEEAAADGLNMLRRATLGAVDDMTLMQRANQLLITGLAESTDEAAQFLGIATRLGPAVGASVDEAVSALNSALLNQSYEVLDSLGISAGAVRQRVAELREEGLALDEAFRMAVLEQGSAAIDRLGDSAEAAGTNLAQIRTHWNNFIQDVGQGVNNTLEAAAGTIINTVDFLNQLGDIAQRRTAEADRARQLLAQAGIQGAPAQIGPFQFQTLSQGYTEEQIQAALEAVRAQDRITESIRNGLSWLRDQIAAYHDLQEAAAAAAAQEEARLPIQTQLDSALRQFTDAWDTFRNAPHGEIGDTHLFTDEDATRIEMLAGGLRDIMQALEYQHEQGIITDDELTRVTQMHDQVRQLADEARRGADAFADMTLPDALTGGADQNELLSGLADQLLEALGDNQISEESRRAIEDALAEASGEATDVTFALRDEVIPALEEIALGGKTEELVAALQGIEMALREGRLLGLSNEEIAAGLSEAATSGDFTSLADAFADLGLQEGLVDPLTEAQSVIEGGVVTGMAQANKEAEDFAGALKAVTENEHRVRIALDVSAPGWLQPLLEGTNLSRIVRDNGGVVPGSDARGGGRFQSSPT